MLRIDPNVQKMTILSDLSTFEVKKEGFIPRQSRKLTEINRK